MGTLKLEDHSIKLLGVSIDSELKFDEHVLDIIKKANSKLSALSRLNDPPRKGHFIMRLSSPNLSTIL